MRHLTRRHWSPVTLLASMIVLVLITALAVYAAFALYDQTPQRAAKPPSSHGNRPQPAVTETVRIGIQTIPALRENYEQDSSLWRLVNKSHPLNNTSYTPAPLEKAPIAVRAGLREDEQSLRTILVPDLQALVHAATQDGVTLTLGSGYRSAQLQKFFFDNYAARDGIEAANKYSALPGQSEHQTGLALDFASGDMACYLEQCFADTPAGRWLGSHAHEYGFILRYTRRGEAKTGYQFEPWHYRYVGKDLAGVLHAQQDMVLEDAWPALLRARDTLAQDKAI